MDELTYLYLAATDETSVNSKQATDDRNSRNLASVPLLFLMLSLPILSMGSPAVALLRRGDRGPEVIELQKKLQEKGYFTGEITGFYGAATRLAVKQFQQENNLRVDGIVGPKTLSVLEPKVDKNGDAAATTKKAPVNIQLESQVEFEGGTAKAQRTQREEREEKKEDVTDLNGRRYRSEDVREEVPPRQPTTTSKMVLKKTIYGKISPKSVVYSGNGLFFAQNMMYSHTITVYDRKFKLVKTIPDSVNLSDYGLSKFKGKYQGSPVEAAFSTDGKDAYISNYQMYGSGFKNPGSDRCSPSANHDPSFLYRINTETLKIEKVIPVGSVPKFNAVSPDNRFVLVTNWCSWDLSVVDTQKNSEIKRVKLGAYPRGIAVSPNSENAYIAVMGSSNIANVNLQDFSVEWLKNIGNSPRHLNMDPAGKYLYATLNGEGRVAKIDLETGKVIDRVATGSAPRSMAISDDGQWLYVVNYFSNTVSKIRTDDMKVLQTVNVNSSPIGITYDPQSKQVWVACYSGSIMVFQD